ncbi:hypothetical protein FHX74_001089 [Friedmanniella endophytica]|uniref:Biopolymer transporter Tol n=1 Tax=Microlunatus kandeliicorticis TaxID=1759536 RepID=A0A7W3P512_9ACTN|nr:biopolymer transporter Tol [Microlunatus kandeliicorticis]MBA8793484.1 hypothetical protein [Microlunatus kandeliicorticis]
MDGSDDDAARSSEDERWLVVGGRRWRRQDPLIPADEAARLRRFLGRARNAVKQARAGGDEDAVAAARRRVGAAKHGLGERGTPWWEQDAGERRRRWEAALAELADLDPDGNRG